MSPNRERDEQVRRWFENKLEDLTRSGTPSTPSDLANFLTDIATEDPLPLFKGLLRTEKMRERVRCPDCGGSGKYEGRWECLFCRDPDHTVTTYEVAIREIRLGRTE